MMKGRRFRFSIEVTLTFLLAAAICYVMGYWQFSRYLYKKELFAKLEAGEDQPRATLTTDLDDYDHLLFHEVSLAGRFDYDNEVVLRNRFKDDRPGVLVVTPLRPETGKAVWVNRGFVPYDLYIKDDKSAYRPEGMQEVLGILQPSVTKQFFLAPESKAPSPESKQESWLRLEVDKMSAQLTYPTIPVFVEQTNQSGRWPKHDPKEVLPPGRHFSYVFQWAGFGTFALFFGFWLQYRRPGKLQKNEQPTA